MAVVDWWKLYPAWRISRLELQDPYGWHLLNEPTLHRIRERLANLEEMSLHEIFTVGHKQNHSVTIDQVCPEARKRLEELKLSDVDVLYSLRISGRERVWGILIDNILTLLWWDPNHEVCPSEKKHT